MPAPLVYGFHPVREVLRNRPHDAVELLVGQGRRGARRDELTARARRHGVACRELPEAELDQLCGGVHNGFALTLRPGSGVAPAAKSDSARDDDLLVLIEDVQDPRNLGALLRVCEGAGVRRVLVRDRGSAPLSSVAVKASAGASEWLEVERVVNSAQEIERHRGQGFWVYGAAIGGEAPWSLDLTGKVMICLGGEADGLRRLTRERCDALIGLPMRGRVDSLNVASAAAAVLYEAVRQRLG